MNDLLRELLAEMHCFLQYESTWLLRLHTHR